MSPVKTILLLITTWFLFSVAPVSAAQESPVLNVPVQVTPADLEQLDQEINLADTLNEEDKKNLSLQVDKANNWQIETQTYQHELALLEQQIAKSAARITELKTLQKQQEEQLKSAESPSKKTLSKEALNKALNKAETDLQQSNQNYLNWDQMLGQYLALATDGIGIKTEIEKNLTLLKESIKLETAGAGTDIKSRVHLVMLKSRQQMLEANLKLLDYKMDHLGQLTELAQTERDYWTVNKKLLAQQTNQLQTQLQSYKTTQAEEDLKAAMQGQLAPNHPLYPLQSKIIQIQQDKAALVRQEKAVNQKINVTTEAINTLKAHFARDKQIVELEGSREIVSQVLHKRLETISAINISSSQTLKIKDQLNKAVLAQLLLNDKLRETESQVHLKLIELWQDQNQNKLSAAERETLENQANQLYEQYIQAAKELQSLYPDFISNLSELNSVYGQQQEEIKTYTRFLNDHLLWLPSIGMSSLLSWDAFLGSIKWFFSFANYQAVLTDLAGLYENEKPLLTLWFLVIGLLLLARKRFIRGLAKTSNQVISVRTDSFLYTLQAFGYTFGLALLIPFSLLGLGALLEHMANPAQYTQGIAKGLIDAGILVFVLRGLYQICRPDGIAERHFRWHKSVRDTLSKELQWATPVAAILVMFIDINSYTDSPDDQQMIGRIGFVLLMITSAVLIYRLWSSRSHIMQSFAKRNQPRKWQQLHFIWFPLLMGIPLFLIWLSLYGYYYSSLVISERINWTLAWILMVYLFRELLLRSLYLSERKIRYAERLQKLQAQHNEQSGITEEDTSSAEQPLNEEADLDYDKLSKQVRQALNLGYLLALLFGIWLLWSDVLLALNLINDSTLSLTKSQMIDGVVQQVPLTLGDLVLGVALGAMTLLLSKDLPGLLEFTLLKHLPISNAARYAISSLTQYIIAIIGFVVIFRALGIEWSNIQWLVAALSVGLGFGLQEIVANFVSGIILLFEQPMRVGDIVTVDGVSGKVSKIRIRATTIINWDRQELVIPNKQIITGQFINWSLTDQVIRVKIDVGIAYGSDVTQALKLIKEAATEHPSVLNDPEPSVIFDSFGDNALQLSLRVFVDDLDNFLMIRSQLNSMINDKLNQAGIVIAFPQRDVHLDTSQPLEIRLSKASGKPARDIDPGAPEGHSEKN